MRVAAWHHEIRCTPWDRLLRRLSMVVPVRLRSTYGVITGGPGDRPRLVQRPAGELEVELEVELVFELSGVEHATWWQWRDRVWRRRVRAIVSPA